MFILILMNFIGIISSPNQEQLIKFKRYRYQYNSLISSVSQIGNDQSGLRVSDTNTIIGIISLSKQERLIKFKRCRYQYNGIINLPNQK